MAKQIRLTTHVEARLEAEQKPRESYSDCIERIILELSIRRSNAAIDEKKAHKAR